MRIHAEKLKKHGCPMLSLFFELFKIYRYIKQIWKSVGIALDPNCSESIEQFEESYLSLKIALMQ